jgi:transposase
MKANQILEEIGRIIIDLIVVSFLVERREVEGELDEFGKIQSRGHQISSLGFKISEAANRRVFKKRKSEQKQQRKDQESSAVLGDVLKEAIRLNRTLKELNFLLKDQLVIKDPELVIRFRQLDTFFSEIGSLGNEIALMVRQRALEAGAEVNKAA